MNREQNSLFFFLRESPAFFMIWLCILLTFAAICAYTNAMGQDEFYRVIFFLQNKIVVAVNIIAFLILLIYLLIWLKELLLNYHILSKPMFICGTFAAIFSPIMMVIIGYFIPFGDAVERTYLLKLIGSLSGKIVLCLMICLPIWYALPRIMQTMHLFNIHPKREKSLILVLAFAWSAHAIYILFVK